MADEIKHEEREDAEKKLSIPKVLSVFFSLYCIAVLVVVLWISLVMKSFNFGVLLMTLVQFPIGILGLFLGDKALWVGMIIGYLFYPLMLIFMLKDRRLKKLFYFIASLILVLILNIAGCISAISNTPPL